MKNEIRNDSAAAPVAGASQNGLAHPREKEMDMKKYPNAPVTPAVKRRIKDWNDTMHAADSAVDAMQGRRQAAIRKQSAKNARKAATDGQPNS